MSDKQPFHITSIEIGVDADFVRCFTTEAANHEAAFQHYINHLNARPLIEPWKRANYTVRELEDDRRLVYKGTMLYDGTDSNTEVYVVVTKANQRQQL